MVNGHDDRAATERGESANDEGATVSRANAYALAFASRGELLVSGDAAGAVKIWDLGRRRLRGRQRNVFA